MLIVEIEFRPFQILGTYVCIATNGGKVGVW